MKVYEYAHLRSNYEFVEWQIKNPTAEIHTVTPVPNVADGTYGVVVLFYIPETIRAEKPKPGDCYVEL